MLKFPYPCDHCTARKCDHKRCAAYRRWLNAAWMQFGRYENHPYWESDADPEEKFLYVHPAVYRKYLRTGPCGRCACACLCDEPCRNYWLWWDARMLQLKHKLQENPSRARKAREGLFYETNSASLAIKSLFLGHFEVSAKYSFQTSSSRLA